MINNNNFYFICINKFFYYYYYYGRYICTYYNKFQFNIVDIMRVKNYLKYWIISLKAV